MAKKYSLSFGMDVKKWETAEKWSDMSSVNLYRVEREALSERDAIENFLKELKFVWVADNEIRSPLESYKVEKSTADFIILTATKTVLTQDMGKPCVITARSCKP